MTKPLAFRGKGQGKHKKRKGPPCGLLPFLHGEDAPWRMFFRGKIRGRRLFRRRPPEEISSCGGKSAFCVIGRFSLEKCSIMQLQGKKEKKKQEIFRRRALCVSPRSLLLRKKNHPSPNTEGPRGSPRALFFCVCVGRRGGASVPSLPAAARREAKGKNAEKAPRKASDCSLRSENGRLGILSCGLGAKMVYSVREKGLSVSGVRSI